MSNTTTSAFSLTSVAAELIDTALRASSGRGARTIHGGHEHALRQTVVALARGRRLDDHESPGEATLQVIVGRVRLVAGEDSWDLAAGDYVVIPPRRHSLEADEDSAVLLTVVTAVRS